MGTRPALSSRRLHRAAPALYQRRCGERWCALPSPPGPAQHARHSLARGSHAAVHAPITSAPPRIPAPALLASAPTTWLCTLSAPALPAPALPAPALRARCTRSPHAAIGPRAGPGCEADGSAARTWALSGRRPRRRRRGRPCLPATTGTGTGTSLAGPAPAPPSPPPTPPPSTPPSPSPPPLPGCRPHRRPRLAVTLATVHTAAIARRPPSPPPLAATRLPRLRPRRHLRLRQQRRFASAR